MYLTKFHFDLNRFIFYPNYTAYFLFSILHPDHVVFFSFHALIKVLLLFNKAQIDSDMIYVLVFNHQSLYYCIIGHLLGERKVIIVLLVVLIYNNTLLKPLYTKHCAGINNLNSFRVTSSESGLKGNKG